MASNFTLNAFPIADSNSTSGSIIKPENVVVVYRDNDQDSEDFADFYLSQWEIDPSRKIGIPCSSDEILDSYSTFKSEVEDPIDFALSSFAEDVYVIILGYNVPGGFIDDTDIISATSRISRINYLYSKKTKNVFYDRKASQVFNSNDLENIIICSRIDAPTLNYAKNIVKNNIIYYNQYRVNGRFYYDPYSSNDSVGSDGYKFDLNEFLNDLLYNLNLTVSTTSFIDEYTEVVTPYLQHDSFYWGWGYDRATSSFFRNTDTARIFFYNADSESGVTLRNTNNDNFSVLALNSGYIASAGAMSNPGIDGYLRPLPFFSALKSGATIGEAFYFSSPYIDWTISLFGDPLINVSFPSNDSVIDNNIIIDNNIEVWRSTSISIAKLLAHHIIKERTASEALDIIVKSDDLQETVQNVYSIYDLSNSLTFDSRWGRFRKTIDNLYNYLYETIFPFYNSYNNNTINNLQEFLDLTGFKLSRLLIGMNSNTNGLDDKYFYNEGYWEFETEILNESLLFENYHFELDVSDEGDFSNILLRISSLDDINNWYYEKKENLFSNIPSEGVPSSYNLRRIKYKSKEVEYLDRAREYYFRFRQINENIEYSDYRYYKQVIYT